jgi:hypothetical protein
MVQELREVAMSDYEIYALKYAGPFVRTGAHLMWYRDWDTVEKIYYYIWCIKGGGRTVVVDTGVTPALAQERDLEGYMNPAEVLARIDVKAEDVRHVVITHPTVSACFRGRPFTFRKKSTASGLAIRLPRGRRLHPFQMPYPRPTSAPWKARIAWSSLEAINRLCPASNACWRPGTP